MSIAKQVHIKGYENVVEAYRQMGVPSFSIWSHSQLLFKKETDCLKEGEQALRGWLELTEEQNYGHQTIKFYDDCPARITAKTDYSGSFNFQIHDNPNAPGSGHMSQILDRLNKLEAILSTDDVGGEEPEKQPEVDDFGLGQIGKIIQHPKLAPIVDLVTDKISDVIIGMIAKKDVPKKVAGIAGNEQDAVIAHAVARLKVTTPNLGDILSKLADLSEQQPQLYKQYLKAFSSM